jgi:hypothetical protein
MLYVLRLRGRVLSFFPELKSPPGLLFSMSIFDPPVRLFNQQGRSIKIKPPPNQRGTMKLHVLSATILLLIMTAAVRANDKPNTADSSAAFAQLKSLAGDRESKAPDGKKSYARDEVISGDSAVVEQSDEMGPANAMVTVYSLDADCLRLTHDCMAHNQPRMQAESFDPSTGELRFAFLDATGMSDPEAGHMHNATFRFVDANHLTADWQFLEGGKPKMTESLQYTRVH